MVQKLRITLVAEIECDEATYEQHLARSVQACAGDLWRSLASPLGSTFVRMKPVEATVFDAPTWDD